MKIYNSTESIKEPKVGELQLEVNSMWKFDSRTVCFKEIEKTFGGGKTIIAYDLKECISVTDGIVIGGTDKCKNTIWKQAEITPEIKNALIKKGYLVK